MSHSLEDLIHLVHETYKETLPLRKEVLEDPAFHRLSPTTIRLLPSGKDHPRVTSVYPLLFHHFLSRDDWKTVMHAVYAHTTDREVVEGLERGRVDTTFFSIEGFSLIHSLATAFPPFREQQEGFSLAEFVLEAARHAFGFLASTMLLTEERMAENIASIAEEAGNAFTFRKVGDDETHSFYEYANKEESIHLLAHTFPHEKGISPHERGIFVSYETTSAALFTIRFLQTNMRLNIEKIVFNEVKENEMRITSPHITFAFPKSTRGQRILKFIRGLPKLVNYALHRGQPAAEALLRVGITPRLREWKETKRLVEKHARGKRAAGTSPLPPPLPEEEDELSLRVEQAYAMLAQGVETLREKTLSALLEHAFWLRDKASRIAYAHTRLEEIIQNLHGFLATHDPHDAFHGHSHRVAMLLTSLARPANLPVQGLTFYLYGLAHDLGKLTIPPAILTAPRRLTPAEWFTIFLHPYTGFLILHDHANPYLRAASLVNLYHHENWKGKGYPYGKPWQNAPHGFPLHFPQKTLLDEQGWVSLISLVRIADSLDAMFSRKYAPRKGERGYNIILPEDRDALAVFVREDVERRAGSWYDPQLVRCVTPLLEEIQAAYERLPETNGLLIPSFIMDDSAYETLLALLDRLQPFKPNA